MNIRSVGPALHLAPRADARDGRFDFVCARTGDRPRLMEHFEARVAGKKSKSPLPTRRFRELRIAWKGSTIHVDDELWRDKKKKRNASEEITITVKPSALIVLHPGAAIKT
jgi:diacylglycerol kinase family enzyme